MAPPWMLLLSILLSDCGVAQQEIHPNYGVVFHTAGKMATAMQRWGHTFELTVPQYKTNPLKVHQCQRDAHHMLRTMFTRVNNTMSEQLESDITSSLKQAAASINTRLNVGPTSLAPYLLFHFNLHNWHQ